MLVQLHLINSYLGIRHHVSATALPFCIWQMKGYYDTIPTSLEEPENRWMQRIPDIVRIISRCRLRCDHRPLLLHVGVDGYVVAGRFARHGAVDAAARPQSFESNMDPNGPLRSSVVI